jgi:nicotinate-nucleotide pyrophosphorylase
MSGIATKTAQAVQLLADPTIKILDTRKTMPGLRMFEKAELKLESTKIDRSSDELWVFRT